MGSRFCDKLDYLMALMDLGNTELSRYAGCSDSLICRIRNGSRPVTKENRTVKRIANALVIFYEDREELDMLCVEIGCGKLSRPEIADALIKWSLDGADIDPERAGRRSRRRMVGFSAKLSELMKLAGLSNVRLSAELGIDPSYLSRLRNGQRHPRPTSPIPGRISDVLAVKLTEQDKLSMVADIMCLPRDSITESNIREAMRNWLFRGGSSSNVLAVKEVIDSADRLGKQKPEETPFYYPENDRELLDETIENYQGFSGLQRAVIRFLGNAIENGSHELLLYSDQGMEWMGGPFMRKWKLMMAECLRRNVRITIIHNVDRESREMLEAISAWMPLYATGLINPYYCLRRRGDRFGITMFIDPGRSCIFGCSPKALESEAEYTYYTRSPMLRRFGREFMALIKDSRPLVRISHEPVTLEKETGRCRIGDIEIIMGENQAALNRLAEPRLGMAFDNPALYRSFRLFADGLIDETE